MLTTFCVVIWSLLIALLATELRKGLWKRGKQRKMLLHDTEPWRQSDSLPSAMAAILTFSLGGANFTRVSPALTWHSSAAAHHFGCVLRLGSLAHSIFKFGVAVVHTDICRRTRMGDKMHPPDKLQQNISVLNHEGE